MEDNTSHVTKQQFPGETHNKPENTNATKNPPKQDKDRNKKCATFTYHSPQIRKLTNLFKHTNINIAFKNKHNTALYKTKDIQQKPRL